MAPDTPERLTLVVVGHSAPLHWLLRHNTDLAIVFQNRNVDLLYTAAPCPPQGRHEFVVRQTLGPQDLLKQVAVVNEDRRPPLDQAFQPEPTRFTALCGEAVP